MAQKKASIKFSFYNKVLILLFVMFVLLFVCMCLLIYKSINQRQGLDYKIINDISVINDDKKYISEREFKQRFKKAYIAWRKNVQDLDDEYNKIDGALYIIQNNEIIIYFHNGYEPTFVLKYDNVSDNWYETSPE